MNARDDRQGSAPAAGRPGASAALLYLFAVFSGAAALMYQVAWTNLLSFTFGSSTVAASAVVAGFMGGMGLGAWGFHRLDDRIRRPLSLYAGLELGIALSTALLTLGFGSLPQFFASAASVLPPGLGLDLFRLVFVVLLVLVPSALMGATYPALCVILIRSTRGIDLHLGRLYGLNTLGAALGALVAGMLLIEWIGLRSTVSVANVINLGVAATAAWAARRVATPAPASPTADADGGLASTLPHWLTGIVLFGSGFTTLGYEILWFRALRYLFGNSVYALTVMLVVFLLGLGIGALLLRRAAARPFPEYDLGRCQIAIATLALVYIHGLAFALEHEGLAELVSSYPGQTSAFQWWGRLLIDFATALVLMLPATLFMGLSFPLATRLFLSDVSRLGERVGVAYLLANLGSILGAISAAMWLVPLAGTVGGTRALVGVNALLGAGVVLWLARRHPGRTRPYVTLATVALVGLIGFSLPARFALKGDGISRLFTTELLWEEENDLGTVQVWTDPKDPERQTMSIDGTTIGTDGAWAVPLYQKQVVLAHLGMRLDPSIRHTLNIGLATGSTLNALATYPSVETLDAVEINPAVVRGSRLHKGAGVLDDPRTRIVVEDVSQFLLRTQRSYDLIISDGKQRPGHSGNSKLLCRDFYQAALQRLGERGILIQWLPLHTLAENYASILRTFADTFPEMEVFVVTPDNSFVVGSRSPIIGRADSVPASFGAERALHDLGSVNIPGYGALLARWVTGRAALFGALPRGRINTWDHSPLEFNIHRARSARGSRAKNLELLLRAHKIAIAQRGGPIPDADPTQVAIADALLAAYAEPDTTPLAALEHLKRVQGLAPGDRLLAVSIGHFQQQRSKPFLGRGATP